MRSMTLAIAAAGVTSALGGNLRPIIGILTLPSEYDASYGRSYFPASYVKWVESGGARVVPLPFDAPLATTAAMLKNLNGALFTGGGALFFKKDGSLTQFALTAQLIFNESVAAAAAGETFPLWGTCLGFELINVLAAGPDASVLTPGWDSENLTTSVEWAAAAASSRLWGGAADVRTAFAAPNRIALNAHQSGVSPAAFAANSRLSATLDALATSSDRTGKTFVASVEGKTVPVYATQWHPEKIAYEWDPLQASNHSRASVVANGFAALFFDEQARQNDRAFPDAASENAALIYNFAPVDAYPKVSGEFDLLYFFAAQQAVTGQALRGSS